MSDIGMNPGGKERQTSFLHGLKEMWEIIEDKKTELKRIFLLMLLAEIITITFPLLFKFIIDRSVILAGDGKIDRELVMLFVLGYVSLALSLYWDLNIVGTVFFKFINNLEKRLPVKVFKKLLSLSLSYHQKENTGEKAKKIERGSFMITRVLDIIRRAILPSALCFIINVSIVFYIDYRIGLVLVIPMLPAALINRIGVKKVSPEWRRYDEKEEFSSGEFYDSLINIDTVQCCAQEKRAAEKLATTRDELAEINLSSFLIMRKYRLLAELLIRSFLFLTLAYCCVLVLRGEVTVGVIFFLILTGKRTYDSIGQIIEGYSDISEHLISIARMKEILDARSEIRNEKGAIVPETYEGRIKLNDVTFFYPGVRLKEVLKSINLSVESGQMIALVGKTGAGKTTIVNLFRRAYEPTSGTVTLDGRNIKSLNLYWYRKLFAVVPQASEIFNTSILENIRYAHPEAGENEVMKAVKAAQLEETIKDKRSFPEGIYTDLSEKGRDLSGGQKQRIAFARAFIALMKKEARVLILDEYTSDLDSITEKELQEIIMKLKKEGISIIVIAHRLATVKGADKIFVIDDGSIVETGTHEELMEVGGSYVELVKHQKL